MSQERYTTKQVVDALRATKGMVSLAAQRLNCEPMTIRNYIHRHPTIAQAMKEIRESTVDIAELSLFKAIQNGEAWAVAMYLKTIGRDRGYIERSQIDINMVREEAAALAKELDLDLDEVMAQIPGILKEGARS